jgi:hypothetical protein
MSEIKPEPMYGVPAQPDADETVIARFVPDAGTYWRSHAVMALIGGIVAGVALLIGGNPAPWVGPVAAVLAIGARAAYLKSEVFAEEWRLTHRRLLGPAGRIVPLSGIKLARPFLGAVQIVTQGGDKHLIKYQAHPAATVARIEATKGARP